MFTIWPFARLSAVHMRDWAGKGRRGGCRQRRGRGGIGQWTSGLRLGVDQESQKRSWRWSEGLPHRMMCSFRNMSRQVSAMRISAMRSTSNWTSCWNSLLDMVKGSWELAAPCHQERHWRQMLCSTHSHFGVPEWPQCCVKLETFNLLHCQIWNPLFWKCCTFLISWNLQSTTWS